MKKKLALAAILILSSCAVSASDYYWVPDLSGNASGNWTDLSHWSKVSGGVNAERYTVIPGANDNVIFDAQSSNGVPFTVTIDINVAICHSMTWSGVPAGTKLISSTSIALRIYGSLRLDPAMNFNFLGPVNFESNEPGNTISTAGQSLFDANFNGLNGEWTLLTSFTVDHDIYINGGSFQSGGNKISCARFFSGPATKPVRTINIENSEITVTGDNLRSTNFNWALQGDNLTLKTRGSHIRLIQRGAQFSHSGAGARYHLVSFSNRPGRLDAAKCQFTKVTFNDGWVWYSTSGSTNTFDTLLVKGGMYPDVPQKLIPGALLTNDSIGYFECHQVARIKKNCVIRKAVLFDTAYFTGSNKFDTLQFMPGSYAVLLKGEQQDITKALIAGGSCTQPVILETSDYNATTNLFSSAASVSVTNTYLKGIRAYGGAGFSAAASVDLGGNTGWTFGNTAARNLFWVGGSGNWNDPAHWSLTSGGAGGQCPPTPLDDVNFNGASFTGTGSVVSVNSTNSSCANITWAGATFNPEFSGNDILRIYGSLTLIPAMTVTHKGPLFFQASTAGQTITTAGQVLQSELYFNGAEGGWTLLDDLKTLRTIYLNYGHLNSNTKRVEAFSFQSTFTFPSNLVHKRKLTIANSLVYINTTETEFPSWNVFGDSLTLEADQSEILIDCKVISDFNLASNFSHQGEGKKYYNVYFRQANNLRTNISKCQFNKMTFDPEYTEGCGVNDNRIDTLLLNSDMRNGIIRDTVRYMEARGLAFISTNCRIDYLKMFKDGEFSSGGNSIGTLDLSPGRYYSFAADKIQTITDTVIARDVTCTEPISFVSSVNGLQATLSITGKPVRLSSLFVRDIKATGNIPIIADASSDLGNNTGWTINSSPSRQLYWIGGSGNWNDPQHWSAQSGGQPGGCIPTASDDVFFDQNSFSALNQKVTVNIRNAVCRDMTWTSALYQPTFKNLDSGFIIKVVPTGSTIKVKYPFRIYGSLKLKPFMNFLYDGEFIFAARQNGKTITTAQQTFINEVSFDGLGGGWILQDTFRVKGAVNVINGSFQTNNQYLDILLMASRFKNNRQINISNSTVFTHFGWEVFMENLTLNASNSTLIVDSRKDQPTLRVNTFYSNGGPATYHDVIFEEGSTAFLNLTQTTLNNFILKGELKENAANTGNRVPLRYGNRIDTLMVKGPMFSRAAPLGDTINTFLVYKEGYIDSSCVIGTARFFENATAFGNNVYDSLIFTPGYVITLGSGRTQRILKDLVMRGNGCFPIYLRASSPGVQSFISKASGVVSADYIQMRDQQATGGAQFFAGNFSTDIINNTNWLFRNSEAYSYGLGADTAFCGQPILLDTRNFNGGTSWLWQDSSRAPTFTAVKTGTYFVRVTYSPNCALSDTIVVFDGSVPPAIAITASKLRICANNPVTFLATASNGGQKPQYRWIVNGLTASTAGPVFTTSTLKDDDQVSCEISSSVPCANPRTKVSNVITIDVLTALVKPEVTPGTVTPISAEFTWKPVPDAVAYQVSVNGGPFLTPSSGPSGLSHLVTNLNPDQTVTLTVKAIGDSTICENLSSASTVTIKTPGATDIYFPNAFTPNQDGLNDTFRGYGYFREIVLTVFNQWGELIFTTKDPAGWDGKVGGRPQPLGTYVFTAKVTLLNNSVVSKSGVINLIR